MHPLEFFAYNMQPGQMADVTVKDGNGQKTIRCYFYAFKSRYDYKIMNGTKDLIPVFVFPNKKNGEMGKTYVKEIHSFDDILSIGFGDSWAPAITMNEIYGYVSGSYSPECLAEIQIRNIVKEMSRLFPGKRIHINGPGTPAAVFESHGGIKTGATVNIISVGYDNQTGKYNVEVEGDCYNGIYDPDNLTIKSYPILLEDIMTSVAYPEEIDRENKEDYIDLASIRYAAIPRVWPNNTPTLFKTMLIDELRCNKWWKTLSDGKKRRLFAVGEAQVNYAYTRKHGKEPNTFNEAIEDYWKDLDVNNKLIFMEPK